jgi:hypothetical protein
MCVSRSGHSTSRHRPSSPTHTLHLHTLTRCPPSPSPPSIPSNPTTAYACRPRLRLRQGQDVRAGNEWAKEAIERQHPSRLRRRANPLAPPPAQDGLQEYVRLLPYCLDVALPCHTCMYMLCCPLPPLPCAHSPPPPPPPYLPKPNIKTAGPSPSPPSTSASSKTGWIWVVSPSLPTALSR